MSDEPKPKPIEDLKEGLNLLFRAAKGAVEKIDTHKVEDVAKDAAKEMTRAFDTIGNEIDRVWNKATGKPGSAVTKADAPKEEKEEKKKDEPYDDAYAPEPPKGPRVG
jgi:hypothetical protein